LLFERKEIYTIEDLLNVMTILRSPEGCPWDREQTHASIRNNFLEEAYEAVEAIDSDDADLLQEELGDVLLQVVFHSRLEQEKGSFAFADVVDSIVKKLIVRHPHVFGNATADTSEEVLTNWEAIKKQTHGRKTDTEVLEGVSKALPALMRSERVQKKAAKAAGEPTDLAGAVAGVKKAADRLGQAVGSEEKELGELLFATVQLARLQHLEAEQVLSDECDRFITRFRESESRRRE
jgi:tetrapyrrole methylase family protein/MazG family protein